MSKKSLYIKKLVLTALFGGSLSAVKACFMYIPNVEAVTLLIVAYSFIFGNVGFFATMVFCTMEGFLFGFNPTWLVAYYVHWGFLSCVVMLCKRLNIKKPLCLAVIVFFVTALFGFTSTFTYYLFGGGLAAPNFISRYWATYISGFWFYFVQCVTNFFIIFFGFLPITKLLIKMEESYFPMTKQSRL